MTEEITVLAVGDVILGRERPKTMFRHTAKVLNSADITFAQLEQMYSPKGCPNPIHATPSHPRNIPALKYAGFDVVSLAGNHTLDWGPEGLLDTVERIKKVGIAPVGVGKDIDESRQPVVMERKGTKVAFLAYGCIGPEGYEADVGKPGYAPMRAWNIYKQLDYQPGTPPLIVTIPYKEDLAAMIQDIKRVRPRADVVIVSFHWGLHFQQAVIPMYEFEVGHAAIDAGADLILGHHPHILKGMEVYNGKVIVHSMGNFALEVKPGYQDEKVPFFRNVVKQLYHFEPDPEYPTYPMLPEAKATIIVKAVISGQTVRRVSYLPCYVNKEAEPEIQGRRSPHGEEVFSYMEKISRSQGLNVRFSWDGDEVVVTGVKVSTNKPIKV